MGIIYQFDWVSAYGPVVGRSSDNGELAALAKSFGFTGLHCNRDATEIRVWALETRALISRPNSLVLHLAIREPGIYDIEARSELASYWLARLLCRHSRLPARRG